MSADVDADEQVETPDPVEIDLETNGNQALRPLHELDDQSANRVVNFVVSDSASRPTVDEAVTALAKADVALAFRSSSGFGFVATIDGQHYHYKKITDDEKVDSVAQVEQRSREDVAITKKIVDAATLRTWVHLAIDTDRFELVALDDVDVFDDTETFAYTGGRQ